MSPSSTPLRTLTSVLLLSSLSLSLTSCGKDHTPFGGTPATTTPSTSSSSDSTSSSSSSGSTSSSSSSGSTSASSSSGSTSSSSGSSSGSGTYSAEAEDAIAAIAEKYEDDLAIVAEYSEKDSSTFTDQDWAIFNNSKSVVENISSEFSEVIEKFSIELDENFDLWAMRFLIPQMGAEGITEEFLHVALTGRFSAVTEAKVYSLLKAFDFLNENSDTISDILNTAGNAVISAGNSVIDFFTDREKIVLSDNEDIANLQKFMYNMKEELERYNDVTEFFTQDYTTFTEEQWSAYIFRKTPDDRNCSSYLHSIYQNYAGAKGVHSSYQAQYDEIFELLRNPTWRLTENIGLLYDQTHGTITEDGLERLASYQMYEDLNIERVQLGYQLMTKMQEDLGIFDNTYLG